MRYQEHISIRAGHILLLLLNDLKETQLPRQQILQLSQFPYPNPDPGEVSLRSVMDQSNLRRGVAGITRGQWVCPARHGKEKRGVCDRS